MKVLHVTLSCSRNAGGLFESVRGLVRAQQAAGIEAKVVCVDDTFTSEDIAVWPPETVTAFPASLPGRYGWSTGLVERIRAARVDVIHLHGIWNFAGAAIRLSGNKAPLVISPRGMLDSWILRRRAGVKRASMALVEGPLLRRAHVHALNESECRSVRHAVAGAKIFVAPNAVGMPAGRETRLENERFVFCFLGRLHEKKGLLELIDAVSILGESAPRDFVVRVFGWGDEGFESTLRERLKVTGLMHRVELMGAVQGAAKVQAFREADAFVLPSFSEGLPMAVLEAASYGLPILMTKECNLPRFFEAGAAIEIDQLPSSIAEAMGRVLESSDLHILGERARSLVASEFSWEASLPHYLNAYRSAMEGGASEGRMRDVA